MALEQRADVDLNAEGKRIEHVVHTAAVSRTQVERACQVVVESDVDPVVPGQAHAPSRRARRTLVATNEDLLRSPRKYVVAGTSDTEFVAEIEFGACLKVGDIAVGSVRAAQEPRVRNRVAKSKIDEGRDRIKSVGKMIAPVNGHMTSAQSLRGACGRERAVQAGVEIKSTPFRGISETQVRISHAIRGGGAGLRGRRIDEEIWHAHVHGKVFAKAVANGRV